MNFERMSHVAELFTVRIHLCRGAGDARAFAALGVGLLGAAFSTHGGFLGHAHMAGIVNGAPVGASILCKGK